MASKRHYNAIEDISFGLIKKYKFLEQTVLITSNNFKKISTPMHACGSTFQFLIYVSKSVIKIFTYLWKIIRQK